MTEVEQKAREYAIENPTGGTYYGFLQGWYRCRAELARAIVERLQLQGDQADQITRAIQTMGEDEAEIETESGAVAQRPECPTVHRDVAGSIPASPAKAKKRRARKPTRKHR